MIFIQILNLNATQVQMLSENIVLHNLEKFSHIYLFNHLRNCLHSGKNTFLLCTEILIW